MEQKNILLFVNTITKSAIESIRKYQKKQGETFRIAVIWDIKTKHAKDELLSARGVDVVLSCDFSKPIQVEKALLPYKDSIVAITCRGEANVHPFTKIVPHVPYVRTPTVQSLLWATDKIMMRELLRLHDKRMAPRFTVVHDAGKASVKKIIEKVGFPLVIKPAGLAQSLLVTLCFHEEELEASLKKVYRKITRVYKENKRTATPKILVEQFMDGDMYSVDGFVTSRGKVSLCPLVHVKTGRTIGFDDFFNYIRIVPTTLSTASIHAAEDMAKAAVRALGLRSTSVHIELMKTEEGWKVIELGPRLGGYRDQLYSLSYGIDLSMNDILVRIPRFPVIPKKRKLFAAAIQFYAKREGTLVSLKGPKKVQKLKSFIEAKQMKKVGDKCLFSKHGGKPVYNIILANTTRAGLLADIRRTEQYIDIQVEGK